MQESYSPTLELTFNEELEAVIMDWNGFSGSDTFHEANERVLRLLKHKGAKKIIADLRDMKIIKLEDQRWLYENWLPRAAIEGLCKVAIVESGDFFNRLTVDSVCSKVNSFLEIKHFRTYLGARNWIRQN